MVSTTNSDSIIAYIETNLSDWDAFLVCADALLDEGNYPLSRTFLWCHKHQRRPENNSNIDGYGWYWMRWNKTICHPNQISKILISLSSEEEDEIKATYNTSDTFKRAMERLCSVLLKKEVIQLSE